MKMSTKTTFLFLHITCEKCLDQSSKEFFFQFKGKHHRQTAMDKKTAVSFANIFMAYIKTQILSKQNRQSLNQQFGIDPWDVRKSDIAAFFAQANFSETYITLIFNSRPKYLALRLCF